VNREELAATALLALPRPLRASRGEEILGTLLDSAGTGSRTRVARELAGLVHNGWRARTVSQGARRRVAGAGALAWTVARIPDLAAHNPTFRGLAPTIMPLVCFTVLILAPRHRGLDLRRLAWLTAAGAIAVAYSRWSGAGPLTAVVSVALVGLMVAAVVTSASDPRLAIACALPATYVALMVAGKPALPPLLLLVGALTVMTIGLISARPSEPATL
jgi:hypothetical protein